MKARILGLALLCGSAHVARADGPLSAGQPPPLTPPALSVPGGLTADEVARRAQATSPDLQARGRALAAAEAGLDQALAAFLPRLTLTARYARFSSYQQPALQTLPPGALRQITTDPRVAGTPSTLALAEDIVQAYDNAASVGSRFPIILNQYLAQAGLMVPVSDYVLRLSSQYAAASHSVRAAALEQKAARATTRADARILYYHWLRALAQAAIAERSLAQARLHLDDAERHLRAGLVAPADVSRVRVQVANAELVQQRTRNVASLREEQLRMLMHDPASGQYVPGEELELDPELLHVPDAVKVLQAEAMSSRLEIRALQETAWSFQQQAKVSLSNAWPQLSVFGNVTTGRPNARIVPATDEFRTTWDVGAQLLWTPSDALGASALASQARAKAEEVQFQKAALRDGVALEVFEAHQQWNEAALAVSTTLKATESANETYVERHAQFRNGRATSAELTESELDWARAQLDAIQTRADLRIARVRLNHAVGRDTQ